MSHNIFPELLRFLELTGKTSPEIPVLVKYRLFGKNPEIPILVINNCLFWSKTGHNRLFNVKTVKMAKTVGQTGDSLEVLDGKVGKVVIFVNFRGSQKC